MRFLRLLGRLFVGIAFGFVTLVAISPALAAFAPADIEGSVSAIAGWTSFFAVVLLCAFAPSTRRAFGRGCLAAGAAIFLLPISTMLLSGVAFNEAVGAAADADKGFAVIGAGLAGGAITAAATFIGLILGSVLLIAGLILSLGGRREVVVYGSEYHSGPRERSARGSPSARIEPPMTR